MIIRNWLYGTELARQPGWLGYQDSPLGFKRVGSANGMARLHVLMKTQIIVFINTDILFSILTCLVKNKTMLSKFPIRYFLGGSFKLSSVAYTLWKNIQMDRAWSPCWHPTAVCKPTQWRPPTWAHDRPPMHLTSARIRVFVSNPWWISTKG